MTLEQELYQHIRRLGYWDCAELTNPNNQSNTAALAWSNPNTTAEPETMFKIVWLLSSSTRRNRLNPIDLGILQGTAAEIVHQGRILPVTQSYVKYLWEQVYCQEYPQLATSE